jgi:hypothetical protein
VPKNYAASLAQHPKERSLDSPERRRIFNGSGRAAWMSKSRSSHLTARVVSRRITSLISILHSARRIFPPLKKLLFEVFWFVFAAVEIVRFLRSLH